jgi:hypothetical protein
VIPILRVDPKLGKGADAFESVLSLIIEIIFRSSLHEL